jgi:hypothetical protein
MLIDYTVVPGTVVRLPLLETLTFVCWYAVVIEKNRSTQGGENFKNTPHIRQHYVTLPCCLLMFPVSPFYL